MSETLVTQREAAAIIEAPYARASRRSPTRSTVADGFSTGQRSKHSQRRDRTNRANNVRRTRKRLEATPTACLA